jgi:hypothetical protein
VKELPHNTTTFIRRLFRDVIKNVKSQMQTQPNDYIRLNIHHPSLDSHEEKLVSQGILINHIIIVHYYIIFTRRAATKEGEMNKRYGLFNGGEPRKLISVSLTAQEVPN